MSSNSPYQRKPNNTTHPLLDAFPLAKPATIREALRANHEQMVRGMGSGTLVMHELRGYESRIEYKAECLAQRATIKAQLAESLYIYEGVPIEIEPETLAIGEE